MTEKMDERARRRGRLASEHWGRSAAEGGGEEEAGMA